MDSLTQFTLGAAVSAALLGPKMGARKAAIIGGVLGTIPDLDVLLPFDTPVDSFVFHRGWTHSIFVHALAAPVFGEILVRSFEALRDHRIRVWLTVFLVFATHAIIDAVTVYGTRIFWPLYPDPVGVGSLFIIDPLYSVPLIIVVLWALFTKTWTARLKTGLSAALIFSSAYILLSFGLQAHIEQRARTIFAKEGIETEKIFPIAAPFNTVLWKVIGHEEGQYHNLYISLFDDDDAARLYSHPNGSALSACLEGDDAFEKLDWFSRGYYRLDVEEDKIVLSDLRMGLTPGYVFRFAIGETDGETVQSIAPQQYASGLRATEQDFEWLMDRLVGLPSERQAELTGLEGTTPIEAAPC